MSYKIDKDKLLKWIKDRFPVYKEYKNDYLVPTPYKETGDQKLKLSISPSKLCFHCWRTDESGPLWKLVVDVDQCSKQEAFETIYDKNTIGDFDEKINSLKKEAKEIVKDPRKVKIKAKSISLPKEHRYIDPEYAGELNRMALEHVSRRNIDHAIWKIGYCPEGKYQGRLIIPIFDKNGDLSYWIARSLWSQNPKYLNPSVDDFDVAKEEILFSKNWKFDNEDVFVAEGVFNAITLINLGFNAIAILGKVLSSFHIENLRKSKSIVFAFDNDRPGQEAILKNLNILKNYGKFNVKYVIPDYINSDWNDCSLKRSEKEMKEFIEKNVKILDFKEEIVLSLKLKSSKNEQSFKRSFSSV